MTSGTNHPRGLDPSTLWRRGEARRDGRFPPGRNEELLLRAALLDGDEARNAVAAWERAVDVDRISFGSYRLLPLLFRNSERLGVSLDHAGLVGGVYRRSWYRNSILLENAARAVDALHGVGIESMLLKGAALILEYHDDRGVRPLGDVDVLVRRDDYPKALDTLLSAGWSKVPRRFSNWTSAIGLEHVDGGALDLHRLPMFEHSGPASDHAMWEAGTQTDLGGRAALVQSPADLLLHVVAHGLAPYGAEYWVADAFTVITRSPDLDWDRFIGQALERHLPHSVLEGVAYVAAGFDVAVPDAALVELRHHVEPWERREFRAYGKLAPRSVGWETARMWYRYRRRCAVERRRASPWGFLSATAEVSGASRREVVRAMTERLVRRRR